MTAEETPVEPTDVPATEPKRVGFDLIKSNFFRVVYADGVFGGLSPSGMITMSFFNERVPLPTRIEHYVTEDGRVGGEDRSARQTRQGIVREVETEIVMTIDGARTLHEWLGERIKAVDERAKTKVADQ
jgi:hypothetical protein